MSAASTTSTTAESSVPAATAAPSERTRVRRLPKRASYDRAAMHAILDEGLVCHAGFVHEGQPVVIPTAYGRDGDVLILHGSVASRMLRTLGTGVDVCVTVTLVDGLVLARSAFHHSMNYRSVVIFGRAVPVEGEAEKEAALCALSEHLVPGRWEGLRSVTSRELKGTTVLALPLDEASVKTRSGPPLDDDEDYALPIWAGVLPIAQLASTPVSDERLTFGTPVPEHVSRAVGSRRRSAT